jgi:nucleoside-diphosphate-sugar epimerase
VQGILGALDTAAPKQKRVFNLGNTAPHTVSEFVGLLEQAMRKQAIRNVVDLPRLGDVLRTHSNITAAHAAFGYAPQVCVSVKLALPSVAHAQCVCRASCALKLTKAASCLAHACRCDGPTLQ